MVAKKVGKVLLWLDRLLTLDLLLKHKERNSLFLVLLHDAADTLVSLPLLQLPQVGLEAMRTRAYLALQV